MITPKYIDAIRKGINSYPFLKNSYNDIKAQADVALAQPINVPTPKDGGGGPTHEQHKKNYSNILNCGIAYQVSKEKKYANYIKDILLDYAAKYQSWHEHPARKPGQESGRIFWQSLNDFVWQVYTIQGYDMVYDAIGVADRKKIESQLFIPILTFFTEDCYTTFNKIHNHGTWCLAAVALTGYVLNKPAYVEKALNGSNGDRKSGYWAQLDELFSPDGYYAEGPYYQRYAIFPFLMLAKAINNYQPELKVFEYRHKILAKAINTALQTTYTNGLFFPVNDAIKDKSFESPEIICGVNIAYADMAPDPSLLGIVQNQKRVTVSDAGLQVCKAIHENKAIPFHYTSTWLRDGKNGDHGGLGVLRFGQNTDQQCVVLKATSQGMGHGHFDRLNLLYYDKGDEVFADYGAARFLNIESKGGGGYLPENDSWAKQTVAHNTIVVDRQSDFKGDVSIAEKFYPKLIRFSNEKELQVMCAQDENAYPGVLLSRTLALVVIPEIKKPLLIDICKASSEQTHQYDLPFWYNGDIVDASFNFQTNTTILKPLGTGAGYQHIWLRGETAIDQKSGDISILNNYRFYTLHFATAQPVKASFLSTGANDPNMNIKNSNAFMLSQEGSGVTSFVNIIESHGEVDPVNETVTGANTAISGLYFKNTSPDMIKVFFTVNKSKQYELDINYKDTTHFIKLK